MSLFFTKYKWRYLYHMIQREIEPILKKLFRYFPVISLNGPRQAGKSTLLKHAFKSLPYHSLENPDDRELALNDPKQICISGGIIMEKKLMY